MRAVWQVSPLDRAVPQYPLLRSAGINRIYFAALYERWNDSTKKYDWLPNDIQLNPTYYTNVVKNKFQYGIFRVTSWENFRYVGDPIGLATAAHEDIDTATGGNKYLALPYMFDIEQHDPNFILSTFKAYRRLRPTRRTSWTLEPNQGGWLAGTPLVDFLNNDPYFFVVPQLFYGNMAPANQQSVRDNLVAAGLKNEKILFFYNANDRKAGDWATYNWSGCLLDAEHVIA